MVGAGTMGSGIAHLAALSGARTLLYDLDSAALASALAAISETLGPAAATLVEGCDRLEGLEGCDLVIEAIPESLGAKQETFSRLGAIVDERCVLATNTSSLSVTAIAAGTPNPNRVVGMHFFNPAPVMKLIEIVAGQASDERSISVAIATAQAMGKQIVTAEDRPGFLVNRCMRPFGLEALRMLGEQIATPEQIDRICRLGGGFRMGPFELMDLVGLDVGFDIARSLFEQSFGEPRWRPSPITAQLIAAGRTGQKTGRGFYDYTAGRHRPEDGDEPSCPSGDGLIVVTGERSIAHDLKVAALAAGWEVEPFVDPDGPLPWLILDCGSLQDDPPLQGGPQAILCAEGSLAALDPEGSAVGFHLLGPIEESRAVELTRSPTTSEIAVRRAVEFFSSLGKRPEWVADAPGLVLGRIVCQLVNEAAFALAEGVGTATDIDLAMVAGLNYPLGPLEWGDTIGLDHVLDVLDGLADEYREDRYRAAPLLRKLVWEGRLGKGCGAGFFLYPDETDI